MQMHGGIKKFQMVSEIADDSYFIRQQELQQRLLTEEMVSKGYIPVLDLGPYWSTAYNEKEKYDAIMTMYGYHVGKRKACLFQGVDGAGQLYPASTQKSKLNQS